MSGLRMDEKTWKEATTDAETTPWWVHELIAEGKRARSSEADLLQAAQEALLLIKGLKERHEGGRGVYAGEEALARAIDKARGE